MTKPVEFVVHFESAAMTPEAQKQIAHAVQAATLAELARLDLTGGEGGLVFQIPHRGWLGLWLTHIERPEPTLSARGSNPMPGSPAL